MKPLSFSFPLIIFFAIVFVSCARHPSQSLPMSTDTPQLLNNEVHAVVADSSMIEWIDTGILAGGEGSGGTNFLNPVWSHDGSLVAYKYHYAIWVVNTATWENPRKIYDGSRAKELGLYFEPSQNLVWSPDDQYLGFTLMQYSAGDFGGEPLMAQYNLKEDEVSLLLDGESGVLVDWGARGIIICLYSEFGCSVIDLSSGKRQVLGHVTSPFFVNKNQIVYFDGDSILIHDLDNGHNEILDITDNGPSGISPVILSRSVPIASPDAQYITWINHISRQDQSLLLYNRFNSELLEIQNANSSLSDFGSLPGWSPDSKQFVLQANGTIWLAHLYSINGD